jgi:hypothetical protein
VVGRRTRDARRARARASRAPARRAAAHSRAAVSGVIGGRRVAAVAVGGGGWRWLGVISRRTVRYERSRNTTPLRLMWVCVWICVRVHFVCRSCLLGVRVVGSHFLRPVIAISHSRSLVIRGIAVPPIRLSSNLFKTVIQPRQPEPLRAARRHRRRLAVQLVRKRARPPRWRPAARCDRRGSGATCRRGGVSTHQRGGRRRKLLAARGRRAASIGVCDRPPLASAA